MKIGLTIVFLTMMNAATAYEIRVSRMKKSVGYSERYELNSSHPVKVILDCQSFVQGLLFGPVGETAMMLQEWECQELATEMKRSHRMLKSHCVQLDLERDVLRAHHTCP